MVEIEEPVFVCKPIRGTREIRGKKWLYCHYEKHDAYKYGNNDRYLRLNFCHTLAGDRFCFIIILWKDTQTISIVLGIIHSYDYAGLQNTIVTFVFKV